MPWSQRALPVPSVFAVQTRLPIAPAFHRQLPGARGRIRFPGLGGGRFFRVPLGSAPGHEIPVRVRLARFIDAAVNLRRNRERAEGLHLLAADELEGKAPLAVMFHDDVIEAE